MCDIKMTLQDWIIYEESFEGCPMHQLDIVFLKFINDWY